MPVPVSRDRLARPVDISTLLDGATRRVNLIVDEPGLQRVGLSGHGFRDQLGNVGGGSTSTFGVQRVNNGGDNSQGRTMVTRRGGGGSRGRRGQLPSWYPRTPLRDITGIMRAIERRRAELGLNQDAEAPQEEHNAANTQVGPDLVSSTPVPIISVKPRSSPATQLGKLKATRADWTVDSENITPQKKLLESIEKVREAWLENQRKLERTPIAKRVEREKKVRVLMSMR